MTKQTAKKAPDLFATATQVEAKPIDPFPIKKRDDKEEVDLGPTLDILAAIKALTESLNTVYTTCEKEIKDRIATEFVSIASKNHKRPDSFRGVSLFSESSCELRKRASNIYLKDEEKQSLDANAIPTEKKVIAEAVPERFFFNPDLVTDANLASKISAALAGIPELEGKEILRRQVPREEQVRYFVGEGALENVCSQIKDRDKLQSLLAITGVLANKPMLKKIEVLRIEQPEELMNLLNIRHPEDLARADTLDVTMAIIRKAGVKI